jgi:hypothetical protein
MSKQKSKDNPLFSNEAVVSSSIRSNHINKVLCDMTNDILSKTQLYNDSVYAFICDRINTTMTTNLPLQSNNLFGITKEEFDLANRSMAYNPRLSTILSLSYGTRQPYDYSMLTYSMALCVSTLATLHNTSSN